MTIATTDSKYFTISDYTMPLGCGIFGSLGALSMKFSLQKDNVLYSKISEIQNFSVYYNMTLRIILFGWAIWFNLKMVEFKIKGFAKLGASSTVIIAFFSNYILNIIYEMIIYSNYPNIKGYLGSLLVFVGLVFFQKEEAKNAKKTLNEENPKNDTVDDPKTSNKKVSDSSLAKTNSDKNASCTIEETLDYSKESTDELTSDKKSMITTVLM